MRSSASWVEPPRCGVATTLGWRCKLAPLPSGGGGSTATTSIAAPASFAGVERLEQVVLDDDAAARAVDEIGVRLHHAQLGGIDHAARLAVSGTCSVTMSDSRSSVVEVDERRVERIRARRRDERIVTPGSSSRRPSPASRRCRRCGRARRCPASCRASSVPMRFLAVPAPFAQRSAPLRRVAREREHQRKRLLGRGDRVRARRVEDDDAGVGRGIDVDRVDADARARDDRSVGPAASSSRSTRVSERTMSPSASASASRIHGAWTDARSDLDPAVAKHGEAALGERFGDDDAPLFLSQNRNRLPLALE